MEQTVYPAIDPQTARRRKELSGGSMAAFEAFLQ